MKKGFALIELLVVVLIIGILAAVALPQYNKAVEKARVTEVWTTLNAIVKATTAYRLETGESASFVKFEDLPVQFFDDNGNAVTGDSFTKGDYSYHTEFINNVIIEQAQSSKGGFELRDDGKRLCFQFSSSSSLCKDQGFTKPATECAYSFGSDTCFTN